MHRKPTKKWWRGYEALYGNPNPEQLELMSKPVEKKSKPASDIPTEVQEQIVLATWLSKLKIPFYHVPNGGYRDYREAMKFKRMGVQPGVPDICIPLMKKGYGGLYIELKRVSGGSLSVSQRFWGELLTKNGYLWIEAKGAHAAMDAVIEYLNLQKEVV